MKYLRGIIFVVAILSLFLPIISRAEGGMGDVEIHAGEFTGYVAYNNDMEGGLKDVSGNWLDADDRTCAAPEEIPLGSKITIGGTGTWLDGLTFTVTDRGGAIIVDEYGRYHIDILMHSFEQANAFGRVKHGYIVVKEE